MRLHNTGFADARIRCMFEDAPPTVGYAATAHLCSGEPPMGGGTFHDRADFWNSILEVPAPRILVLEDMDTHPGRGAFVGDMHAAILRALGCIAFVTNGAVANCLLFAKWDFSCLPGALPFLMPTPISLRLERVSGWVEWTCGRGIYCTATGTAFLPSRRRLRRASRPRQIECDRRSRK